MEIEFGQRLIDERNNLPPAGLASLATAKVLGGIGWILTLLLIAPYNIGAGLSIVGFVMILLAVKNIADVTGEKKIFSDMVIGVVIAIVGLVAFAATVGYAFLRFVGLGGLAGNPGSNIPPSDIISLIAVLAVGLLVVWIFAIVSSVFFRRSYDLISKRVGVGLFGTASLLYLIGAVLTIILVGFLLIFIAEIMFVVAFFSLPDQLPAQTMAQPQPAPPPAPSPVPVTT